MERGVTRSVHWAGGTVRTSPLIGRPLNGRATDFYICADVAHLLERSRQESRAFLSYFSLEPKRLGNKRCFPMLGDSTFKRQFNGRQS